MTKRQQQILTQYERSSAHSVREVYGRLSSRKIAIENSILRDMLDVNGSGYRVTGHNSSFFSCGFTYERDGERILRHYTASKTVEFAI